MIPEGWVEMPLRAVLKLASGESRPKDILPEPSGEHTCPVYGGNGVLGYSSAYNSMANDIIIGRVGEYCGVTRFVSGPKWITDNALFAKSVSSGVDREFLALRLRHFDVSKLRSKGGQPLVSQEPIYAQTFAFPPIDEQRSMVSTILTWDRAIETVEALIANARAQKKVLMQSLLTGKRRLPGFSGDWLYRPFGDIAETVRTKVEPVGLPDHVRGIELEHIESGTGRLLGTCRANAQASLKTPFSSANVLYGKLRPYLRKFVRPDFAGVCSTEIWVLAAKLEHSTPEFLHLLVQSPTFVSAIDVSSGSKMPRGDWGIVRDTVFAVPSLEEQQAISRIVHDADAMAAAYEAQLAALRKEKSALMQQLLTGKRRVKVDEREAA